MPDVFEREKHMAKRTFKRDGGTPMKKVEHTYTADVKKQVKKNKGRQNVVTKSAITQF